MPANKKYLSSPLERIIKLTAGFIGGFMVTQSLHLLMAVYWNTTSALITLQYFGFIIWAVLLIVAFLAKSGWKIWVTYLLISLVLIVVTNHKQALFI